MKYIAYVIASKKPTLKTYVGWTNNLANRIKKHNSSKGAKATRGRKWKVIYKEIFTDKILAMKREYQIKKNIQFRNKLKRNI